MLGRVSRPIARHAASCLLSARFFATKKAYDAVIVGGGSVGVCTALSMAEMGMRPLVVEERPSVGQGQNKHAIGGIRATHANAAKVITCLRSLEVFRTWKETHGDEIEFNAGGYLYPMFREEDKAALTGLFDMQRKWGLNIGFVEPDAVRELVPGISMDGLLGGVYSPEDGSTSPLLSALAFFRRAEKLGAEFLFGRRAESVTMTGGKVTGVVLSDGTRIDTPVVVDSTGGYDLSQPIARSAGLSPLPLFPDSHEAGITEPVERFMRPMVVDVRPGPNSKNFYFYQNTHGQVIFCLTPNPLIEGVDESETGAFLPQISKRMIDLVPRLRNIRVRRVWRGLYPMTPDGQPIVGWEKNALGLFHAVGMCGHGFMLGPGLGEIIARAVQNGPDYAKSPETAQSERERDDAIALSEFSPDRPFQAQESALK